MKRITFGLFTDSKAAGDAVAELNGENYTDKISLVLRDEETGEVRSHQVKQDVDGGTTALGAATGAAVGALGSILGSATPVTIAGVGALLVGGPLTAVLGAAAGAAGGALVGALIDLGFPDERANLYQHRILAGEILVAVTTDVADEFDTKAVLLKHGAQEVASLHVDKE